MSILPYHSGAALPSGPCSYGVSCLGLGIDVFSNTPGLAAGSMTLVAAVQPYIMQLFIQRDDEDDVLPMHRNFRFRQIYFVCLDIDVYLLSHLLYIGKLLVFQLAPLVAKYSDKYCIDSVACSCLRQFKAVINEKEDK
jgi:hypothetical protein